MEMLTLLMLQVSPEVGIILANLINMVLVVGLVGLLKKFLPGLKERSPLVIQVLALVAGVGVPFLGAKLTELIGFPIDLSPIMGVFTGIGAIGLFHFMRDGFGIGK